MTRFAEIGQWGRVRSLDFACEPGKLRRTDTVGCRALAHVSRWADPGGAPGMSSSGRTLSGSGRVAVAAFELDGTLVPGDSLRPFLIRVLGYRRFLDTLTAASPFMVAEYRKFGRDGAKVVLLRRALRGLPAREVLIEGEQFGQELVGKVRPEMAERLRWHRVRDHRLILVSASLAAYLEPFGRHLGFDQVMATRLAVDDDGLFSGELARANVGGQEKAERLRAALASDDVELWAYGDGELLTMADHPVRARPELTQAARAWWDDAGKWVGQLGRTKWARAGAARLERTRRHPERSDKMD